MSGDLRVATAQLRELAAEQRHAATEIRSAVEVADGVDTSVRVTHGVISWSTATAVEGVQNARRAAGSGMKGVAEEMADKLDASAGACDGMAGGPLGDRMQTR
jgi:hypothetical protein